MLRDDRSHCQGSKDVEEELAVSMVIKEEWGTWIERQREKERGCSGGWGTNREGCEGSRGWEWEKREIV